MSAPAAHVGGMAVVRARKRSAPKRPEPIRHNLTAPPVVQAAQIALIAMKKAKCANWKGMVELAAQINIREKVILTAEQQELIDRYANILPYLQTSPLVTVVACTGCGRFGFYDGRPAGAKCYFTLRCTGKLMKASAANERITDTDHPAPTGPGVPTEQPPAAPTEHIDDGLFD